MTHAQLVERAVRWLQNTAKCSVVLAECGANSLGEIPDAIGWDFWGESILVECKVSRADFCADKRKGQPYRPGASLPVVSRSRGAGNQRYYMAPKGLLKPSDMPEGYGLLEVSGRIVKMTLKANPIAPRRRVATNDPVFCELRLLVAEMRRQLVVTMERRNGLQLEAAQ